MIQNNYFSDNPELVEYFQHYVDWPAAIDQYEDGFKDAARYKEGGDENLALAPGTHAEALDFYKTILESMGELVGKELAPVVQEMDRIGLKYENGKVIFPESMVRVYTAMQEAGLQPYAFPRNMGGIGLPAAAQAFLMEILGRGDGSMALAFGCPNIGEVLGHFADDEMQREWIPRLTSGELTCAMALTEPNYGSDLSNLQCRAEKDEKGNWILNGSKRFITHGCGFGDTPAIILTLARTGSPTSGARGLSFFVVKSEDVFIAGIEEKMGLHCSATCEVVYENSPGLLIGKEGEGLIKGAMGMMNSARLSIAAQSMGIASAAYMEAVKYAGEREQFGRLIKDIPAVARILNRMEREIAAMRALTMEAARSVDMYVWRKDRMKHEGLADREIRSDPQIRRWEKLASLFTPLSKYYVSEWCNRIAYDAIQVHGGSGFTEEYDVARIYRDARITTIYEGTTQLQVVGAIGGVISGLAPSGFLRDYITEETSRFPTSERYGEVMILLDEVVRLFKEIEDGNAKDELAYEVVESAARALNGMLLEQTVHRAPADRKEKRAGIAADYHLDSLAAIEANLVKLRAAVVPQPAAV